MGLGLALTHPSVDGLALAAATVSSPLDDSPEPLVPERPKTEVDSDRVEAMSLFTAGRSHEQREEFAEALRCYQRALRRDPTSSAIIGSIITVAVQLNRHDEAIRYAVKAAELKDADRSLLRRLGTYLTAAGDYTAGIALYEKVLPTLGTTKETASDILLRMEMGRLCHLTGKHKQAAACFDRVIEAIDHPDRFAIDESIRKVLLDEPGPTYQLIGECYLAADRPDDAKVMFDKAETLVSNKAMRQFNLARVLLKSNRPTEAMAALEASFALHLSGEDVVPYQTLAEVLKKLGKSDELIGRLEKLCVAEPDAMPLRYFLAEQYRAAGKLDKAESLYVELLKRRPESDGYRELFDIYRKTKRFDALLSAMGECVEKIGMVGTLDTESRTMFDDADATRATIKIADAKLQSASGKFGYGEGVAAALLALDAKQYEAAGRFFNAALATKPKQPDELFMVWGVGLLAGDQPGEAAKVFQRAIDEKAAPGGNPLFPFYLAGAMALAGQTDAALAVAEKLAGEKKDSARFRGRPAWVLVVAKRHDEAIRAYESLIEAFGADYGSSETRDVLREARLALSDLAVAKGNLAQAEEWLEQVLDEFPGDRTAMNDLGYLWADENKNLGRARRMIQEAVDAQPDNMAYRDSLGWVLFREGRFAEAAAELEKAAADKKADGIVFDHLGDAYRKMERSDKAVEAWRRAVELLRKAKEKDKADSVEKKMLQAVN